MSKKYLVTGAAGFIGSHLTEALLNNGYEVIGIDSFVPYYPKYVKDSNLSTAFSHPAFHFYDVDLRSDDLTPFVDQVDVVFHLAAMAGLAKSWTHFDEYMDCNILATQRLLEAVRETNSIEQFIYASTSSVYGSYIAGTENTPLNPVSPYGITKLAAEKLVQTYERQFGIPSTILRYFSVYGPRQRPDMGYHVFIDKLLQDEEITLFGDGTQQRNNTYVTDIVAGTLLAHQHFSSGSVYNLGGTEEISVRQVIGLLEEITGKKARIRFGPERYGEQIRTRPDISLARRKLGYRPETPLHMGLEKQIEWQLDTYRVRM